MTATWTPLATSRERLLAAAAIIATEPDRWNQKQWTTVPGVTRPGQLAGKVDAWLGECGTTCCIAGTGVALTPPDQITANSWSEAGAEAFGLAPDLARAIFTACYRPVSMPRVLRLLATVDEPRTLRAAITAGLRDLAGAYLTEADLTEANLVGANFAGAYLIGADLTDAYLGGANLTGTDLTNADLTGTILTDAQISARWLPDGWRLNSNGRAERVTPPQPELSTISRRPPMTDTITGWRTVATHGSPTTADVPALIRSVHGGHFLHDGSGTPLTQPRTRWIPLAELDALPDAPPSHRTVTITIKGEDAQHIRDAQWGATNSIGRVMAAVQDALVEREENITDS